MRFTDELLERNKKIWDDCAGCDFLNKVADESLDMDLFYDYLIQDSLYLRTFIKVFAFALIKSDDIEDMRAFHSMMGLITSGESKTRLDYLAEIGVTDADMDPARARVHNLGERLMMKPACRAYCDFLISRAAVGGVQEILMALLPCVAGYGYVFRELARRAPRVTEGRFGKFVADYVCNEFQDACSFWLDFAEEKCAGLGAERRASLADIFREASLHELAFWRMAGDER